MRHTEINFILASIIVLRAQVCDCE